LKTYEDWWTGTRSDLVRGGLWLRGDEPNRVLPSEWDARPWRVLFTRLSTWEDTRESFTHRLLYGMVSDLPGIFPDLAWVPPHRDGERMTESGVPWLLGSGSKRGCRQFDCVALSNALVQELVNVPVLLERSGIPLSREERMGREDVPLVLLGGANSLYTSALFGPDPMVDGIFLGEEPGTIREIFSRLAHARASGASKREALGALADLPGFFVPDSVRPVARKAHGSVPDLNRHKLREVGVAAAGAADSASLQISEGCPYFCSFCAESWSRKPYREVPLDAVRADALALKRELGLSKLDLYSFNFNTVEHVRPLVAGLLDDFEAVGLKSQRFDAVAHDPTFPRLLKIAGKTSITCGLEGISPRLRSFLQKDLSDDELYRSLSFLLKERLRELKVFLIATGRETEEDFEEYRIFLRRLRELLDRAASRPRVVFSATPLVCFPWTPLEFHDMPSPRELTRIVGLIKGGAVSAGFEFRGAAGIEEAWVSQVLVRARDTRPMEAVRRAQARTGFVFRDAVTPEFFEALRQELSADGTDPEEFVRGYSPEGGADRPWSDLEPGVARRFLVKEWEKCGRFEQTPVCLGWVDEPGKCHACGACTPPERDAIVHARTGVEQDLAELERRLKAERAAEKTLEVRVELDGICQGLPMEAVHARHARAWMKVLDIDREYRRHEAHGRSEEGDDCIATGLEVLRPVFRGAAADRVVQALGDPSVLERVNALFAPHGKVLGPGALPAESGWIVEIPEPPDLAGWLGEEGIKHTLRRDGAARVFEISRDSLRKKVVSAIRLEGEEGSWRVRLETGPKFGLAGFLRRALPGRLRNLASVRREAGPARQIS
jgi:radical SAM superfamily enzyme YgiQ (UPF0313 family)